MWPPCLIRTKILTSANENSCRVCTTPGLTSFSNGENCIVLLFSEHPVEHKNLTEIGSDLQLKRFLS